MQGLGNDFIVIDNIDGDISLSVEEIRKLSDRRFGIGFDQLLMVENPIKKEADFRYVIFNADGTEVSQCGNGARCFALYIRKNNLTNKNPISVETSAGIIKNPPPAPTRPVNRPTIAPSTMINGKLKEIVLPATVELEDFLSRIIEKDAAIISTANSSMSSMLFLRAKDAVVNSSSGIAGTIYFLVKKTIAMEGAPKISAVFILTSPSLYFG